MSSDADPEPDTWVSVFKVIVTSVAARPQFLLRCEIATYRVFAELLSLQNKGLLHNLGTRAHKSADDLQEMHDAKKDSVIAEAKKRVAEAQRAARKATLQQQADERDTQATITQEDVKETETSLMLDKLKEDVRHHNILNLVDEAEKLAQQPHIEEALQQVLRDLSRLRQHGGDMSLPERDSARPSTDQPKLE